MIAITIHDELSPEESAVVDRGIGEANSAAAPLHEVRSISCFAKDEAGTVVGGAVGRWWGDCCELQQLWVAESHRRQGIGKQLMDAFETKAQQHGCKQLFLETFSFQSPEFYEKLGYTRDHQRVGFPHGILKYLMSKGLARDT